MALAVAPARGPSCDAVVVGAGPVGLAAVLAAARRGRSLLVARRTPPAKPPRIDAVPAPFLALLLELGVHPALLGVRRLHDTRLVAWERAEPEVIRGPATAHIERPALERLLAGLVARTPRIELVTLAPLRAPATRLVIDATGRRAISAQRRVHPPEPWLARTFWAPGSFTPAAQAFRMAALPDGYAYRLGSGTLIMVGIVGARAGARRTPDQVERHLRDFGAGWLLAGLPALGGMRAGRGGVASCQWSEGGSASVLRVGDAALARDALAAQGIASGVSDAFQLAAGEAVPGPGWAARQHEQREKHLTALLAVVERCRFRELPTWSRYADFLAEHALASRPGADGPVAHQVSRHRPMLGYDRSIGVVRP
jgi:2-polyprenyl-6-methoxyphenol hydroxylase-like FAD-dependent oxidoreductase